MQKEKTIFSVIEEEKLKKIYGKVFDEKTMKAIHKIAAKKNIASILNVISEGKEAIVFKAIDEAGMNRAVKVYKIEASAFRQMSDYIIGDERFKNVKKNKKELVYAWVRKEYSNLEKAVQAKVRVPLPIAFHENIMIMEFIQQENKEAALTLKEYSEKNKLEKKELEKLYETQVEMLAKLYYKANLIHGDFSEYNLLYNGKELVAIDMGQAVLKSHPKAFEFFERDLENTARFFTKKGLKKSSDDIKNNIKEFSNK